MLTLDVTGMTCGHCVSAVSDAVLSVDGANDVAVDLDRGSVTVVGEPDRSKIVEAITTAGYGVRQDASETTATPASGHKACRCG